MSSPVPYLDSREEEIERKKEQFLSDILHHVPYTLRFHISNSKEEFRDQRGDKQISLEEILGITNLITNAANQVLVTELRYKEYSGDPEKNDFEGAKEIFDIMIDEFPLPKIYGNRADENFTKEIENIKNQIMGLEHHSEEDKKRLARTMEEKMYIRFKEMLDKHKELITIFSSETSVAKISKWFRDNENNYSLIRYIENDQSLLKNLAEYFKVVTGSEIESGNNIVQNIISSKLYESSSDMAGARIGGGYGSAAEAATSAGVAEEKRGVILYDPSAMAGAGRMGEAAATSTMVVDAIKVLEGKGVERSDKREVVAGAGCGK